jgi:hypothetical protein
MLEDVTETYSCKATDVPQVLPPFAELNPCITGQNISDKIGKEKTPCAKRGIELISNNRKESGKYFWNWILWVLDQHSQNVRWTNKNLLTLKGICSR